MVVGELGAADWNQRHRGLAAACPLADGGDKIRVYFLHASSRTDASPIAGLSVESRAITLAVTVPPFG
jgi:hypothetical protein